MGACGGTAARAPPYRLTGRATDRIYYELRWHDGYVIDYRNNAINYDYLFFYEIDENSEWIRGHQLPHRSICFRKRAVAGGPRVSEEMVAAAKRLVG